MPEVPGEVVERPRFEGGVAVRAGAEEGGEGEGGQGPEGREQQVRGIGEVA